MDLVTILKLGGEVWPSPGFGCEGAGCWAGLVRAMSGGQQDFT